MSDKPAKSILQQQWADGYREGVSQGVMVAECDCPALPDPPSRLTWWLIGLCCGALLSMWLA